MKRKLKYLGITLLLAISCLLFLFIYKLDTVYIDSSIKGKAIKELKRKKYLSFLDDNKKQVSTDISLGKNETDTVYWQCKINEHEIFKSIQKINFHIGDGYSGTNINIIKTSKKYITFIKDYSDNMKENQKKYSIENQKLILDKKNYQKGDSIYGKINLKIQESVNKESSVYYIDGYFKGKIN
ncbi:hypothetical protein [Chryseobacterium kwangjuense]|uniref:Uncharacterized protein n=1 Tax=Chryseobacterium kwangjuense TaxID=267125 RepID=A0A135WDG0_9FLAO|nr:hypothetical protein [Chryseobacterium kwangjuense]KXH82964.1 hypothetical protein AU378_11035 [Chryseobacterium kwangjuense]